MFTTYDMIYDRFLSKITDYEMAEMIDDDLETQLLKYLKGAISDFKYASKILTERDDAELTFLRELTDLEQEILAKFMIIHWLNPQILRLENVRNELGNKDFKLYSPANFLEKTTKMKSEIKSEVNQDMVFYYYQ